MGSLLSQLLGSPDLSNIDNKIDDIITRNIAKYCLNLYLSIFDFFINFPNFNHFPKNNNRSNTY